LKRLQKDTEKFIKFLQGERFKMERSFNLFSPIDYRYSVEELKKYLSEEAFIKYKAKVEASLAKVLLKRKFISEKIYREIVEAVENISPEEVYEEEKRIKHDIRALVNCIRKRVSEEAKPYIHLFATSYDIVDTANVMRYRDAVENVILPDMIRLEKIWMEISLRYKDTLQIGRTHGQHAEPITFGFSIALYVHRWGERIVRVKEAKENLKGKFSGAVGAYNSLSIFFENPEEFEMEVLSELGLKPAEISTQIVPPEPVADFFHSIITSFGVLANFADDMRHLQRSEIGEVGEAFEEKQVGSSTMPQKKNPVNFENIKSMWKAILPRILTVYMDQISEHQRDLTNSCSQRFLPEILVAFDSSVRRMIRISEKLQVDAENMEKNFKMSEFKIIAEPLYIFLAVSGHPDAHEYVRGKVMECMREKKSLYELVMEDESVKPYIDKIDERQKEILQNPSKYTGISSKKAEKIVNLWKERLSI